MRDRDFLYPRFLSRAGVSQRGRRERRRTARFRGVFQIIRFNWPWYLASLCLSLGSLAAGFFARAPLRVFLVTGATLAILWSIVSLLASHWVYDLSILEEWDWIRNEIRRPGRAVNLHAGFDETTQALQSLFPECELAAWDCFRADIMTEHSIARAREESRYKARAVDFAKLPALSGTIDCVFLIFAAHEIRTRQGRDVLFGEIRRILKPGGCVLLIEHVRGLANFIAYGPGCWHFLPRKEWLRLAAVSKLSVVKSFRITPLVNIYVLMKGERA